MRKTDREFRSMQISVRKAETEQEEKSYKVSGYASTFEPYVLYRFDGIDYYEVIDRHAFDQCDMSDVIFVYNHEGMVYARKKNGTLKVEVDDHGLKVEADLSSTEESRKLYDAIAAGLIDQMSFAFHVEESSYNNETHTRRIMKVDKLYDTSPVSIPANPGTDISPTTRDYFNGVIEAEKAERLERERVLMLAKAKFNYMEE